MEYSHFARHCSVSFLSFPNLLWRFQRWMTSTLSRNRWRLKPSTCGGSRHPRAANEATCFSPLFSCPCSSLVGGPVLRSLQTVRHLRPPRKLWVGVCVALLRGLDNLIIHRKMNTQSTYKSTLPLSRHRIPSFWGYTKFFRCPLLKWRSVTTLSFRCPSSNTSPLFLWSTATPCTGTW